MNAPENIVIVGGGLAGVNAAAELRERGYGGAISLIAAEDHLPYERPPLSKGVLLGNDPPESVFVHGQPWYTEHDVELVVGAPATAVDLAARTVRVGSREISYDRLLLATGSQPRHLRAVDESGAPGAYLRTIEDSRDLKQRLKGHVLVVGAGWVGLEVAAAARQAGAEVTVVDPAAVPLEKVMGAELGEVFAGLHRDHGVDLRMGAQVSEISHSDDATHVRLSDGHEVRPDLVVVGVGVMPDVALAEAAGLDVDNGVLVDAGLRTSDPHVWAAGDIANHDHPRLGRVRVEHWDVAINQGRHAARAMLGDDAPYETEPYFFTDQYDWGMEYVGHVGRGGYDRVVTTGEAAEGLRAYWVKDDVVVAAMHLNDWDAIDALRKAVGGPLPEGL